MAFNDLTPEEQAALADYGRNVRATIGELARVRNHVEALDAAYGNMQALLAEMTGSEILPDSGGLAGALPLTKDEVVTLTAHRQGLLASYGVGHFALWAKAAGIGGMIG